MATFLIDVSGKQASVVFSDRQKNDTYEEMCICGEPNFDFEINDVDPYKDSMWSGEKLKSWSEQIEKQFQFCEKRIEKIVLEEVGRNKIENWMNPLLEKSKSNSCEFVVLSQLIKMLDLAKKKNGTIIFIGD